MKAKPPLVGFYSGSFDPVTLGHLDVIARAAAIVDALVIGVGVHHGKAPLLSPEQRVQLLTAEVRPLARRRKMPITVVTFDDLVVDAAKRHGSRLIIRGLRDGSDLDYEAQMAGMNQAMAPAIETVFLVSTPAVRHITASLVRQIAAMRGDVGAFVPPAVATLLKAQFAPTRRRRVPATN